MPRTNGNIIATKDSTVCFNTNSFITDLMDYFGYEGHLYNPFSELTFEGYLKDEGYLESPNVFVNNTGGEVFFIFRNDEGKKLVFVKIEIDYTPFFFKVELNQTRSETIEL